ncbi:MAG: haloacid dehalogenase [Thermoprotei archaeon ex4572_64]|nr:MAG: haloacid dehalogenase [Thermoprotei archaeon ex4572_64]
MNLQYALIDFDGVLTYTKSAWAYVHKLLNLEDLAKMHKEAYSRGLIDYKDWAFIDVMLWHRLSKKILNLKPYLRPGALELLKFLRDKKLDIIIITGGLDYNRELVDKYVNYYISNNLVYNFNEIFSVEVNVSSKEHIIEEVLSLDWSKILAIGDGEMDIPVLRKAKLSIAYNPTCIEVSNAASIVIYSKTLYPVIKVLNKLLW